MEGTTILILGGYGGVGRSLSRLMEDMKQMGVTIKTEITDGNVR